jgi:hypothetical protein
LRLVVTQELVVPRRLVVTQELVVTIVQGLQEQRLE